MRVRNTVEVFRRSWEDDGERRVETLPRPEACRLMEGYREIERIALCFPGGEQKRVVFQKGECFIVAVYVSGWLAAMEVIA